MARIDKEKCIGCGLCVQVCKENFEMGSDNKAKIKSQDDDECIKKAIDACPVNAIIE